MTNREKIKWLEQYRHEESRLRLLCAELDALRAQGREVCRARDGREDAPPPDWLARDLAQARQEMEAQAARCVLMRRRMVKVISRLEDERQREVLCRRFLQGQTTAEAADEMGVVPRRVEQLQTEGVRRLVLELQETGTETTVKGRLRGGSTDFGEIS